MQTAFLDSLPVTAAALSRNLKVQVAVGGQLAYTDGRVIHIPTVNENQKDKALGFLLHEAGHICFSNFKIAARWQNNPLLHSLTNALEDARIEQKMCSVYGGAHLYLNKLFEESAQRLLASFRDGHEPDIGFTVGLHCLVKTHGLLSGRRYPDILAFTSRKIDSLSPKLRIDIEAELPAMKRARSTNNVVDIAERIEKLIRNCADSLPQDGGSQKASAQGASSPQSQSETCSAGSSIQQTDGPSPQKRRGNPDIAPQCELQGEPSDASSDGNSSFDASASSASHTSNASKSKRPCSSSSTQEHSGGRNADGADASAAPNGSDAGNLKKMLDQCRVFDMGEDVRADLNKDAESAVCNALPAMTFDPASMRVPAPLAEAPEDPKTASWESVGKLWLKNAVYDSQAARRSLSALVQARSRRAELLSRSGRRLSSVSVARLAAWDTKVFERIIEAKAVNTAVHILFDCSSSMHSTFELTVRSALGLWLALAATPHCNSALAAFPYRYVRYPSRNPYGLLIPHGVKSAAPYAYKIGSMFAKGDTPLAEALMYASVMLRDTRESRKIIIVLTDGEPNSYEDTGFVIRSLEASGIEVHGIGITVDLSHLFKHSSRVDTIADLPKALFELGRQIALNAAGVNRKIARS